MTLPLMAKDHAQWGLLVVLKTLNAGETPGFLWLSEF
jgi:hypothetical protein